MTRTFCRLLAVAGACCGASAPAALGQSEFTYQGHLKQNGTAFSGNADLRFELWTAAVGGSAVTAQVGPDNVAVQSGLVTASVDFGQEIFSQHSALWLQVYVRPSGGGAFTPLTPRQPITAAPMALQTRGIAVDDTGNVGIGTTDPAGRLHLRTASGLVNLLLQTGNSWTAGISQSPSSDLQFSNGGAERMTLTSVGGLGIGETSPQARLHVKAQELNIQPSALENDDILIEAQDAVLGLYSTNQGQAASAIAFKEVDAAGAIVDTWGLARESSGSDSEFVFTYGPSDNYFLNPRVMTLRTNGNVGIGVLPKSRLHVHTAADPDPFDFPNVGGAATFEFDNAASNFPGVLMTSNGTNTGQRALEVRQTGRGTAAFFEVTNATGLGSAVAGLNRGTGVAVQGDTAGSGVNAVGVWAVASTSSNALPFRATQNGTGTNIAIFQSQNVNRARIDANGRGFFNNGTQTGGADVAEAFEVEGSVADYAPGDVLVISMVRDRTVTLSAEPYSTLVAGVYATKPGVLLSERDIDASHDDTVPMGVVGVIPTKVCAEGGPIRRGDLLVTSSLAGHAMRGTDRDRLTGAVLGKALEEFDGTGTGVIRVMVNVK